jgi:hypothetical protein
MMLRPYGVRNPKRLYGPLSISGNTTISGAVVTDGLVMQSMIAPFNMTIPAAYAAIIPGPYDAATFIIDLGAGAVMEVT